MSKVEGIAAVYSIDPAELPFRPSWVDQLIYLIKRLPIPSWLFYVGLFTILTIFTFSVYWIDGYLPFGPYDSPFMYRIVGIYPVMFLAAIHYIDNTARRSFADFRPALGKSEAECARLQYELTTIPSRQAMLAAAIGVVFALFVVFLSDYVSFFESSPFAFSIVVVISIFGFVMTTELLYHTVRQLRLVSRIHSIATHIHIMNFAPLYAFSRLTAQTGLFFILIMCFDLVVYFDSLRNPGLLIMNALVCPLIAVACFILPVEGMHRKLVLEKQFLQREVNRRLETSIKQLYQRVDSVDLDDADAMNKTINSLIMTRELIIKIPTWPWQPETSALFFSALSLPIFVFLIQMLLKNLFGFQ